MKHILRVFLCFCIFFLCFQGKTNAEENNKNNVVIKSEYSANFEIYKVADFKENQNIVLEEFKNCNIDFDNPQDSSKIVYNYIEKNTITHTNVKTNTKMELEDGWYFIIGKDYRFDNKVVSFVPSLIFVMDDIEIIPKQSIKEIGNDKPTNTPTPTNPEDTDVESANRPKPTIPQTGYVIWPFYYVFVIAMVCLLLSIITKHKKVFGIISLVLFLLCFIVFIFKDTEEMESNKQIETSLEEVKSVINSNQENNSKNNQDISYQFDIYSEINDKVEMDSIEIKGQEYVGILVIPSLNLELPIMKDWDYDKLKISPCRYKGSIYTNDFIIAGHNYKKHFTPIKKMNIGEKAYFLDIYENRYEYELLEIEVLGKEDVEYLENTTYDLTLFTCTNGGKDRSVLRFEKK